MPGQLNALMFREDADGCGWDAIRLRAVTVARIAALEALGWTVLVSFGPRDQDIRDTYAEDVQRFNPPRRG